MNFASILVKSTNLFIFIQTANALAFALYNLARNPEKQETRAREIQEVLQDSDDVTADVSTDVIELALLHVPLGG